MNNPTPSDFLAGKNACANGTDYAMSYQNMAEVWTACCDGGHIDWCAWILSSEPALVAEARLFACWCVRHTPLSDGRKVWDLLTDPRSREAVDVAERYIAGKASEAELRDAHDAAYDAARAASLSASAVASAAAAAASDSSARAASLSASAATTYAYNASAASAAAAKVAASLAQTVQLRKIDPFTSTESLP